MPDLINPRIAWGLDIGESSIKAVKLRRTADGGAEILAFDIGEKEWAAEDAGDKDYQLRKTVTGIVERKAFRRAPVVVSIPEPAFSRFIPLPPVDRRRIPEVIRYEARQQIPFPIEEVVWDYQLVREPTEASEETEVAIFSLRSQFVYALLANLRLCKVQPTAVLPVPLALYNYLTFDRDIAKGTIVVDLGAGSTDILICDSDNFRVRNITVSGNGITRALSERLKISHAEAETLKRECKDRVQAERLFKLIQPTLNDLVGQVQRTVGFFKSQIHNVRIEQALLLGDTFKLPGVSEFLANQLGCDLIPPDALESITLAKNVDGAAFKAALPSLGVALGLALQGVGLGRVRVNLMPHELIVRQEIARKRPYVAVAVGCLALLLGANVMALRDEKNNVKGARQIDQEAKPEVAKIEKDQTDYTAAKNKVTAAAKALEEPAGLGDGWPAKTAGFRGCISATNSINSIFNLMSKEILITSIRLSPETGTFTPEQYGGKANEGRRTLPVMKLAIAGKTKNSAPAFLRDELENRLKEARMESSDRPVFANIIYNAVPVSGAYQFTFTITCDVFIGD